jgi:CheY-like chemotaxis protein
MTIHGSNPERRGTILLVEDNPADAELAGIAIRQNRPDVRVDVVGTGDEALAFLRDGGGAPPADLVLLDLNLPGRDGTEVLEIMRSDEALRLIPVIVFSNSDARSDVVAAYRAGANAYLLKPMEYGAIKEALGDLLRFWCGWTCLPRAVPVR